MLFGDLVGFTTLSEVRDPEQVREILSRYFERCREVVARYDGVVEKFIGDAVMAVWGVPVAHEDDAERAVRAGAELVRMVEDLGVELGAPLALRVGIVTGEVAVTIGATAEGMIAGDPVNTASRVQSTAEPGQVWVDAPTRSLTSSTVEYDDTGEHRLKGKAEPVRLYVVRAVHADRVVVDGVQAPLVGRDRELALLRDLFSATAAEGRPRLVVVDGDAGVGKSRLVDEFQSWIDGLDDVVRWHRGRCLSYGDGIAFWALSEAVRTRLGLLEGDTGDTVGVRLDASLAATVEDTTERDHLRPRLIALVAGSADRSFERGDLFASWTRFFELVGAGDPVVLVLDDAHHADDGLLDFVDHVMSTSRAPIFVLAMARPELLDRRPGWGGRRAAVVPLGPLDADAMRALVESLVSGLPEQSREDLVASTGGLPLFAVETVRSLVDRGLVSVDDGHATVARQSSIPLDAVRAPESLRSLVTARLDSLSEGERRAVADASVLGLTFTLDGLVALGSDPATLDSVVTSLLNRELFMVESDRFSGERGQLRFVHAVVRQVAYGVLSRRDRKTRHLDAADFLLAQIDDSGDIDGLVAQHLLDALDAAFEQDDDVPAIRERAAVHLRTAGLRARTIGAPLQAFRLLKRCSELMSDEHAAAVVLVTAADAATDAGEQDAAAALAESARDRLELLGDPVEAANAVVVQARALSWSGRFSELLALLEDRLPTVEATPGAEWAAYKLLERSTAAYAQLGPLERELETYRRIVALGSTSSDPAYRLGAYFAEAVLSQVQEDWPAMEAATENLISLARSRGEFALSATGLTNLSMLEMEVDPRRALERTQEGLAEARRAGLVSIAHNSAVASIDLLLDLGRFAEAADGIVALSVDDLAPISALNLASAAAKCTRVTGRGFSLQDGEGSADGYMPGLLLLSGRLEGELRARDGRAAADSASRILASSAAMQQASDAWVYLPSIVDAVVLSNDRGLAASILALCSDGTKVSTPRRRAFASWGLGAVAALTEESSAPDLLAAAAEALEEFGTPGYAARARMHLGLLLAGRGSQGAAAEQLDAAAAAFHRLGAEGWVGELESLRT